MRLGDRAHPATSSQNRCRRDHTWRRRRRTISGRAREHVISGVNQITVAPATARYTGLRNHGAAMENRTDFGTIIVAVFVAGYAALMLGYVVHDDLGYSSAQIRAAAMIAAILTALVVAIDSLRAKPNKVR